MGQPGRDLIVLQDVRKRFGHAEAVRGVTLAVPEGALVVIIGPSGCGKPVME